MKIILVLIFVFVSQLSTAQRSKVDLEGKTFRGKATELTPPDVDRMPKYYAEEITFNNGKMTSVTLKNFSVNETSYWQEIDERRMVAVNVYVVKAKAEGTKDALPVEIEFTGNPEDGSKLSGYMVIRFPGNIEETYLIEAELSN